MLQFSSWGFKAYSLWVFTMVQEVTPTEQLLVMMGNVLDGSFSARAWLLTILVQHTSGRWRLQLRGLRLEVCVADVNMENSVWHGLIWLCSNQFSACKRILVFRMTRDCWPNNIECLLDLKERNITHQRCSWSDEAYCHWTTVSSMTEREVYISAYTEWEFAVQD